MPKREDEYWAGRGEPRGRGLCPFCGSSNVYYNERYDSWRCGRCEKSFPTPSYGSGGDFGKEARWFGKTTEGERRREFTEVARQARAQRRKYSATTSRGFLGWLKAGIVIFVLMVIGTAVWGLWGGQIAEFYKEATYQQPTWSKASGERVYLVNNKDATDPTWQELVSFLRLDDTDKDTYLLGIRVCADFAEAIHNNAEVAGIKAAWVAVQFEQGSEPHALNAFNTTDRGLIFIDCTGQGFGGLVPIVPYSPGGSRVYGDVESWDRIAYVQVGKTYGLVSLEADYGSGYSDYEQWQQDKLLFDSKRDAYMRQLGGRLFVPEDEYRNLMRQLDELDALANRLGGFWELLGVVSNIEIYW